jgi:hypothetical protein
MLMEMKAFNEAARALVLWGALQVDLARRAQTEEEREAADDLLGLLTPVIKGYLTDQGFKAAVDAQQVYGGHGYIREWGMEQFVRDARIAQIYEGTNGIQALDLVGRKLGANGGRAIQAFFKPRRGERRPRRRRRRRPRRGAEKAPGDLQEATMWLMQNGLANPNNAGAAAYPYMTLMGVVCLGLMWLRMAKASTAALAERRRGQGLPRSQARHRPLLRQPRHARDGLAAPQDRGGRRDADGAAGGGLLRDPRLVAAARFAVALDVAAEEGAAHAADHRSGDSVGHRASDEGAGAAADDRAGGAAMMVAGTAVIVPMSGRVGG